MENKNIILKVRQNKKTKQKMVTIPKDSPIEPGEYVKISKIKIIEDICDGV